MNGCHWPCAKPAKARARRSAACAGNNLAQAVGPGASGRDGRFSPLSAGAVRAGNEHFGAAYRLRIALFTGGAEEKPLIEGIRLGMDVPSHSAAGLMDSVTRCGDRIRADVMVSNNTGPVHMAAALGTPVMDLYAPTNPQHTPWQVANKVLFHDVACRNCYKSSCPLGHLIVSARSAGNGGSRRAGVAGIAAEFAFPRHGAEQTHGPIPAFNTIAAGQYHVHTWDQRRFS